jgi:D-sedoheptulose 7-phosphate isomerase
MDTFGAKKEMAAMGGSLAGCDMEAQFREHAELLSAVERDCIQPLRQLASLCVRSLLSGRNVLFFGNGGSAADAQHLAAELSVRFIRDRRALSGIALTTDSSVMTACGNDLGFQRIFSRQIEAIGRVGDTCIALSTSGKSPNVLRALDTARENGLNAAALTGAGGKCLMDVADPLVVVPSYTTARIQEMHILLGHLLCSEIEAQLGVA